MSEKLVRSQKMGLSVLWDVVSIEVHCSSDYEAQVLFDDLAQRIEAGERITIEQGPPLSSPLRPEGQ